MKMKMKSIAAAVALAVSGQALAAIQTDVSTQNGSGELFLSVWDQGTSSIPGKSYVLDLGISMSAFLANPGILNTIGGDGSIEADTALSNFLSSASGPVVWTVGGISNDINTDPYTTWGLGFSTAGTPDVSGNGNVPQGFVGISNAIQNGGNYLNAVNNSGPNPTNFAENRSYVVTNTASDGYHGSPTTFNGAPGDWGGFFALDVDTALGGAAQWYYVSLLDGGDTSTSDVQSFGTFTLASNGTLNYSAAVVPVPAAVWLFGSGLLGLVGIGRRRKMA